MLLPPLPPFQDGNWVIYMAGLQSLNGNNEFDERDICPGKLIISSI